MLALVPWAPVAAWLAYGRPGPGEPTTVSCETTLFGCSDTSLASTLQPTLAYVVPCLVVAGLLAVVVRRMRWWAALVLLSVMASTIVYLVVLV